MFVDTKKKTHNKAVQFGFWRQVEKFKVFWKRLLTILEVRICSLLNMGFYFYFKRTAKCIEVGEKFSKSRMILLVNAQRKHVSAIICGKTMI